jgi:hypothetical protein
LLSSAAIGGLGARLRRQMRGVPGFAGNNPGFDRPAFRAQEGVNLVTLKDAVGLDRIQPYRLKTDGTMIADLAKQVSIVD